MKPICIGTTPIKPETPEEIALAFMVAGARADYLRRFKFREPCTAAECELEQRLSTRYEATFDCFARLIALRED